MRSNGNARRRLGRKRGSAVLPAVFGLAAVVLSVGAAQARPVRYDISQDNATIAFSTHVANVVPVNGTFKHFDAHIQFDTDRPSAVNIEVSVDDSKIDVPFGGAATLRSKSYFDSAQFPAITFQSDSVQSLPGDRFVIAGNLTIRNVSHPQTLDGILTHTTVGTTPTLHLVFHSLLKRADFGMVADRPLIADDVTLTITTTLRAP